MSWPASPPPIVGVADNLRSLHNVGAIFRTADGAGFGGLVLCGMTGCPPRSQIRKSALGAEEAVPWRYESSTVKALRQLRSEGYQIVALEKTSTSIPLYEATLGLPLALVVGHEFEGISEEGLAEADVVTHLPMRGLKISLNVSVAFGVAAYEIQRRFPGPDSPVRGS